MIFGILCLFRKTTIKLSHILRSPNKTNIGQFTFVGNIILMAKLATTIAMEIKIIILIAK
jgi:hypothetical protein